MRTMALAGAVVLAMAAPVRAQTATTDSYVYCAELASMIESVARAHQRGVPLSAMLDLADEKISGSNSEKIKGLIITVYDGARFNTAEYQERSIAEFRDRAHIACLKGRGK